MASEYSFRCADGGVRCGTEVEGSSAEEVLRKAVEHAKKAHGVDLSRSRTLARYAQSLVRRR